MSRYYACTYIWRKSGKDRTEMGGPSGRTTFSAGCYQSCLYGGGAGWALLLERLMTNPLEFDKWLLQDLRARVKHSLPWWDKNWGLQGKRLYYPLLTGPSPAINSKVREICGTALWSVHSCRRSLTRNNWLYLVMQFFPYLRNIFYIKMLNWFCD